MSGSDTAAAVMTSTEPFPVAKPPVAAPQPVIQSMRLAYSSDGTPVYKPLATTPPPSYPSAGVSSGGAAEATAAAPSPVLPHNLNVNVGESMRKKRGRPRKYGPDGNMALALMTISPPGSAPHPHPTGTFSPSPQSHVSGGGLASPVSSGSSLKKARGRPPGSSKKQQMESLGSAGLGFTPHVINVKTGEDVSSKIMSFSQNGPRAVCILSANGAISNVTLRQAATSGGTATYEGRFDILSLSGSFLLTEVGGQRSRTGGLSVSLAGPDGRVLGGSVAGLLTAASPVQVIVGSFVVDGRKDPKPAAIHVEPLSAAAPKLAQSVVGAAAVVHSPQSHGSLSESSGGSGSPLNQSTGAYNNHHHNNNNQPQNMSSMPWR